MKKLITTHIAALLVTAVSAWADNFSTPLQAGSHSTVTLNGSSSYSCYVSDAGSYSLSLSILGPSGETIAALNPAADQRAFDSVLKSSKDFGDSNLNDNVIAFNTTVGAAGFGSYTITMQSVDAMSANPYLACVANSVVCSFNTYLNDAVYLEVTNTGSKTASVPFLSVDSDGTVVQSGVTVSAGLREDFFIRQILGSSKYGTVVIRPKIAASRFGEGVRARVSQYRNGVLQSTELCSSISTVAQPG